jgi:hypothetical protein
MRVAVTVCLVLAAACSPGDFTGDVGFQGGSAPHADSPDPDERSIDGRSADGTLEGGRADGSADGVGAGDGQGTVDGSTNTAITTGASTWGPDGIPGTDDDTTEVGHDGELVITDEQLSRCHLDQDFVEMVLPPDVQACIDAGNMYDFASKSCFTDVVQGTYACTWDGAKAAIQGLNIPGDDGTTLKDRFPDAKLVGCGQRRGGKTIVLQVWIPPKRQLTEADCVYDESMTIGAECHAYTTGAPEGSVGSAEGVRRCATAN